MQILYLVATVKRENLKRVWNQYYSQFGKLDETKMTFFFCFGEGSVSLRGYFE